MDGNWRPTQGSGPAADAGVDPPPTGSGDWRAQLQPDARSRIVNKIFETLKRHLPVSHPDGLNQLQKTAELFEQRIYDPATSQSDYFRKISLKMLSMETKTQQAPGNAQVIPNENNSATRLPPRGSNQSQKSAIPLMSQQLAWQPNPSTSVHASSLTNIGHNLPGVNQPSTMQNGYVMAQNTVNNGLEQGTSQDIYAAQRQKAGRQQQQQSQKLIYHQHQQPSLQCQHPNINLRPQQQHAQQPAMGLMQPRSQHNQLQQSQQHIILQFQAQPNQLQQQLGMQPQFSTQQRLQSSGGMLLQQNNMAQKNVLIQAQKGLQEASCRTSADSTAQSSHAGAGDWQEDIYQMIQSLKDQYFAELSELFNKISVKLHHVDNIIPPQEPSEQYDRMKSFKIMLDRVLQMLQISKSTIQPSMRDKLPQYKKQIISILNSQRKPVHPQIQQQFQPPAASTESTAQTGHAGADDYWQEEIYQMIKILKDQYFAELSELFNRISVKLQQVDNIIPPEIPSEKYGRMKSFKIMLDRVLQLLQISKSSIQPDMRDKVPRYEKQIISILNSQRRKPVQPQMQQQL